MRKLSLRAIALAVIGYLDGRDAWTGDLSALAMAASEGLHLLPASIAANRLLAEVTPAAIEHGHGVASVAREGKIIGLLMIDLQ